MLYEYLPFIEGWKFHPLEWKNETITRGKNKKLISQYQLGYICRATMRTNISDITLRIGVESSNGKFEISGQAEDLYMIRGMTSPNNRFFWCSKYDSSGKVFVINFAPSDLWFYRGLIEVELSLAATSSNTSGLVNDVRIELIVIDDEKKFLAGLKEMLKK